MTRALGPLFDYKPAYPRSTGYRDRTVSKRAAEKAAPTAAKMRERVLALLKQHPEGLINEEIQILLGCHPRQSQPRTSELKAQGKIEKAGTRLNSKDNLETIWRAI